jgi:hypothetical protein
MKPVILAALLVLSSPVPADAPRDPTRPPQAVRGDARAVESAPVLSAILGSATERTAIFNGKLVRGGDSVGVYDIEAVLEDGVRYRRGGVSRELHLHHSEAFKKPSTAAARAPVGDR